jgi:hypothetical protein
MQPTTPRTSADALMRAEAKWVRTVLFQMGACLAYGALVLLKILPPAMLVGGAFSLILVSLLWLIMSPAGRFGKNWGLYRLIAVDLADRSLQRFLLIRATRRRGRSARRTTGGLGSGGTSRARPDDGTTSE